MPLKTNYKDDVFEGNRKYRKTDNPDGTVSLEDVTTYKQVGDTFAAADINATNAAINTLTGVKIAEVKVADFTPAAPYTLRINVAGLKSEDTPIISHKLLDGVTDAGVIKGAWKAYSCIDKVEIFDGYMIVKCFRKKPQQNIFLTVKGG